VNNTKILYICTPVLLTIATGLSGTVNAEGFSLDSVNKGLTAVQEAVDFSRQSTEAVQSVPEMNSLLNAVPKQSGALGSLAGGVSSALGDNSNAYGNLAGLASTFKTLNLSPDMVDQFVPVVVDYVRTKGGDLTSNMLQSALFGL